MRRHFAGRYHCETEFGSDTRQHNSAGERARKVCTGERFRRCGAKPADSHSSDLTRYVIRGTKQN